MTDPDPRLVDPYGWAMTQIREVLEFALDDGVSGAMNNVEFENLEAIAYAMPPEDRPDPRVG